MSSPFVMAGGPAMTSFGHAALLGLCRYPVSIGILIQPEEFLWLAPTPFRRLNDIYP